MTDIVLLKESMEAIGSLPDEEAGMLIKALASHIEGEEPEDLPPVLKAVYLLVRAQVDRMAELREKRSEAGKMGGRPKQAEANDKQNKANEKQIEANDKQTLTPVPVPIPKPIKETTLTGSKEKFAAAWDAYPKKQGRKEAEAAYLRAIRDGTKHEQIMAGIDAYKAYLARCHIEDQYVKQGSTFFRQQAWNDDWTGNRNTKPAFNFTQRTTDYDALLNAIGG